MTSNVIKAHDGSAGIYDEMSERLQWHGHEALFGMMFEYVSKGETLLDIGTGTGSSSILFHKAGLEVYGADGSTAMLEICAGKGFAKELKAFDLRTDRWPYDDERFDHIIACGLFHFYKDLDVFFNESARTLKRNGTFSFTILDPRDAHSPYEDIEYVVRIYGHDDAIIRELAEAHGFTIMKKATVHAFKNDSMTEVNHFSIYALRKDRASGL